MLTVMRRYYVIRMMCLKESVIISVRSYARTERMLTLGETAILNKDKGARFDRVSVFEHYAGQGESSKHEQR